jgi:hypothetical protein
VPVSAGFGRVGFAPERVTRIGPGVSFAVPGSGSGPGRPCLACQRLVRDRTEVFQRPGRGLGGGPVAEVGGALVHERGDVAQVLSGAQDSDVGGFQRH